ncbi:septal ring lytic transglycosylase RlpA family protein [Patescibacteria group bacterium]|nr:septal ring lytic transglycosylase RlpA family protein [Patescibacteria group bacterium]
MKILWVLALMLTFLFLFGLIYTHETKIKTKTRDTPFLVHKVIKGDSLFRLSRKYVVNIGDIRKINGFPSNRRLLKPGQILLIPKPNLKAYKGVASWYGPGFHGKRMANGEIFNQNEILIAHRNWPLGTKVLLTNLDNGETAIAQVKDRGPYTKDKKGQYTRDIDCSFGLAKRLGFLKEGLTDVKIIPLSLEN